MSLPKYARVAAIVREQIAAGVLAPGAPVPSGAALARATGYSNVTCRVALRKLVLDGVLIPGLSPTARPRVPPGTSTPVQRYADSAARALSAALAAHRHAAGLTQPQLAEIVGMSLTTVGHAETGRVWQSRRFWELADKGLDAQGEILALHDAYRAVAAAHPVLSEENAAIETADDRAATEKEGDQPTIAVTASAPVASVTITWANGAVTTVYPPETSLRSASTTPVD